MKRSDFLQRLIGIAGFGTFNLHSLIPKRKIYLQQFFVAGFRHYKGMEMLEHLQENDLLELRREPNNEHDVCAIALYWQQEKIGYVPANDNELLSRLIDAKALPLVGIITHLNKKVKPWESVAVAIYFLQDESFEIPSHAKYLQQLEQPIYTSTSKGKKQRDLYTEVFDNFTGIVHIEAITIDDIKNHFKNYSKKQSNAVQYKGITYTNITTNDIYVYMYNVHPLHPVIADDGKEYILFEFIDAPF